MKKIFTILFLLALTLAVKAQVVTPSTDSLVLTKQVVEASCGECNFGMKVPACVLAVRINGKAYLVDGAKSLDSYGDAHSQHGMCNEIRKAEVSGTVKNNRFAATSFVLLPPVVKE